jgi:hypothetical protein
MGANYRSDKNKGYSSAKNDQGREQHFWHSHYGSHYFTLPGLSEIDIFSKKRRVMNISKEKL